MPARPPSPETDDPLNQRALWRPALLLLLVVASVVGVFSWQGYRQDHAGQEDNGGDAGQSPAAPARFTDITRESGVVFQHENGAAGEKLLPETMGSGLAFFDWDGDGDQDLLCVNGSHWPWAPASSDEPPATTRLFRNDTPPGGPARFVDITRDSGMDGSFYGMGVAVGDYDGDGLLDAYLTAVGDNRLYRNLGNGKFADVTSSTGTAGRAGDWGTSAAFLDYDRDGDLDLFVANYIHWSRELDLEIDYHLAGVGRAYGPPFKFPGSFPYLFRNEGNGKFSEVAATAGLHVRLQSSGEPLGKSLGVVPVDLDLDGWLDLVVANDTVQNFVFRNLGNGTFKEIGAASGLALDAFGGTRGAMGIDAAPLDEGDQLAIAIGNFANEMTALYVAQPTPMLFSDEALARGIGSASRMSLTFGVFFFDYDLDGWLDLLTVNGHIEPDIGRLANGQQYAQPPQLFWNAAGTAGREAFIPVSPSGSTSAIHQPMVGRGSAYADIDLDGDLDVAISEAGGSVRLLRNDLDPASWLRLELVGRGANRPAIGARIRFSHLGRSQSRLVNPTRGYLSQSELPVVLPVGTGRTPSIEITWPDQTRQTVNVEPGAKALRVVQEDR